MCENLYNENFPPTLYFVFMLPAVLASKLLAATLLQQLGAQTMMGNYSMQGPRGFTLSTRDGLGGAKYYFWTGPMKADHTRSVLVVMPIDSSAASLPPFAEYESAMIRAAGRNKTGYSTGKQQTINLGGLTFHRYAWSGTEARTGRPHSGLIFAGRDGNRYITMMTEEVSGSTSLKVMESAIRTFRKS